jgi:hypothetical protein
MLGAVMFGTALPAGDQGDHRLAEKAAKEPREVKVVDEARSRRKCSA